MRGKIQQYLHFALCTLNFDLKGNTMRKNLYEIIDSIEVTEFCPAPPKKDTVIEYITHSARESGEDTLFICRKGARHDGHDFAIQAYEQGTRAFLCERRLDLPLDAVQIITPSTETAFPTVCRVFFDDPSEKLTLIGITGTKGKTTIALALLEILSSYGYTCGYIGTVGIYYDMTWHPNPNTTPDALLLDYSLYKMKKCGVTHVLVEVSSQGIFKERVQGLKFDICVFSNLSHDHIGDNEHPSFEHYRDTKRRFFSEFNARYAVINEDDPYAEYMVEESSAEYVIRVSAKGNSAVDIYAENVRRRKLRGYFGVEFDCIYRDGGCMLDRRVCEEQDKNRNVCFMNMPGLFSVDNGLCALAVCEILGIDRRHALSSLGSLTLPGRFESLTLDSIPEVMFVIDYAHNGMSLAAALRSIRDYEPRRVICLFGSVGGRTEVRRLELGRVACELADITVITSDNPDFEAPEKIIDDIAVAFDGSDKMYYKIPDRAEAIRFAASIARPGDVVLLAGKGHEKYQLVRGKKEYFCEREILLGL